MRTITDPAQAKALTDVKLIGFVQAFIGQERNVSEVADLWQTRVDAAYYRVRQLERLGLIEVSNRVKRAGRDLKLYRAVTDNFFIPLGIIPEATLEAFLEATSQHFQTLMLRSQARAIHVSFRQGQLGDWGIRIGQDAAGRSMVQLADRAGNDPDLDDPTFPLIVAAWPQLRLDFDDARAIRNELFALFQKFQNRGGAKKYLFHFAIAPLEEGD